ncbi:hypothetical protein A0H81_08764 [Grifola frondosa]|uniref:F-box domain-containing protein n=1 Tax=Grifola frondosa TaxID=5627 RepID=A0A1C7M8V3_GRIFR|nr:hypothetical protein A0H81_08764 [Grifola frondosa]
MLPASCSSPERRNSLSMSDRPLVLYSSPASRLAIRFFPPLSTFLEPFYGCREAELIHPVSGGDALRSECSSSRKEAQHRPKRAVLVLSSTTYIKHASNVHFALFHFSQTTQSTSSAMAYISEPPRSRASATYPWASDQTSSPPPYDYYDIFPPAPLAATAYAADSKAPLFRRHTMLFLYKGLKALHSLESRMASLLNERDMLESKLEQAVRLQSPVQRLPNELLASMFVIGVLDRDEEDSLMLSNLMLVCRYWREVAISTPVLWSRIVTGMHHSIDRARLKLDRSKSVPLDVCVDFSPRSDLGVVTTQSIVHAMDLLRPSIWRWRTFHLTVPNRPQAHAALTRCKEQAPLLEVISIRISHSMQEDHYSNPPLPLFGGYTPRLHSCSFTSFNFNWDISLVSRLRVLKLGGYWNGYSPSVDVILATLRACPQLEELALRNMTDVDQDSCALFESTISDLDDLTLVRTNDARTIQLPRLRKASFYYSGVLRTRTILNQLSFPSLERIELCFLDNVSPIVEHLRCQSLTSLPLRHLRIESCFFNELKCFVKFDEESLYATCIPYMDMPEAHQSQSGGLHVPGLGGASLVRRVRLPAQSRAFPRQLVTHSQPALPMSSTSGPPRSVSTSMSSASSFATHAHILSRTPATPTPTPALVSLGWPQRLHSIDLTRCHQISKEMVQWLRMYVADVKCETVKGVWGETTLA